MVRRFFENLLDNRYVQKVIIFIAIYNLLKSYFASKREWSIIKSTINENDDFFTSLATLGFVAEPRTFSLVSIMPYSHEYTHEAIKNIASTTIIAVIMKYVKSENLLGIIHVDCDIKQNNMIVTTLSPTSASLLASDLHDFIWSIIVTLISISSYFTIGYFFF